MLVPVAVASPGAGGAPTYALSPGPVLWASPAGELIRAGSELLCPVAQGCSSPGSPDPGAEPGLLARALLCRAPCPAPGCRSPALPVSRPGGGAGLAPAPPPCRCGKRAGSGAGPARRRCGAQAGTTPPRGSSPAAPACLPRSRPGPCPRQWAPGRGRESRLREKPRQRPAPRRPVLPAGPVSAPGSARARGRSCRSRACPRAHRAAGRGGCGCQTRVSLRACGATCA